ncbi:MAG TPA: hypothetical protein VNL14_16465 [Candidatus Acidoferrales bacterium]|nr:hypothetical protein [Candidatus Acidoferrales bacterium]
MSMEVWVAFEKAKKRFHLVDDPEAIGKDHAFVTRHVFPGLDDLKACVYDLERGGNDCTVETAEYYYDSKKARQKARQLKEGLFAKSQ